VQRHDQSHVACHKLGNLTAIVQQPAVTSRRRSSKAWRCILKRRAVRQCDVCSPERQPTVNRQDPPAPNFSHAVTFAVTLSGATSFAPKRLVRSGGADCCRTLALITLRGSPHLRVDANTDAWLHDGVLANGQYGEESLTERQTVITSTMSCFRAHEEEWEQNKLRSHKRSHHLAHTEWNLSVCSMLRFVPISPKTSRLFTLALEWRGWRRIEAPHLGLTNGQRCRQQYHDATEDVGRRMAVLRCLAAVVMQLPLSCTKQTWCS
jgi:hypothetical protein